MATLPLTIDTVAALRRRLWDTGFRPVAVYNHNKPVGKPGKQPKGEEWQKRARSNPPEASISPPEVDALNTGILCDGLRVLDIDVDDLGVSQKIREFAGIHLGMAPMRWRSNSPRVAFLYRATEGSPHKLALVGKFGKIEVLGHGQQLAAFGLHETGVPLEWTIAPGEIHLNDLLSVTEAQIDIFLTAAKPFIGVQPSPDLNQKTSIVHALSRTSYKGQRADDPLRVVLALMAISNDGPPDWEFFNHVGMATHAATGGSQAGFAAFCAWSEKNPAYNTAECSERWQNYHKSPPNEIGAGTLFYMAHEAPREGAFFEEHETAPSLQIINPGELENENIPEREWIVDGWLPVGCVTANYGDGGTGKTLLAQQLMTACATGTQWIGLPVMRCPTLGFFCEDDRAELHRRQVRINQDLGIKFSDLGGMRWISGVGKDNSLVTFDRDGGMHLMPLLFELASAAKAIKARLVLLDTAADHFSGNENDRHQVRQFIGALTQLAIDINGAVLLNAHPSRAGKRTGDLDGGSTAWNNSVRSRWSLARPDEADVRVLSRRKANYSSIGDEIQLRWVNGVFLPRSAAAAIKGPETDAVFLAILDRYTREGRNVSHSNRAGNYAPAEFAKQGDRKGCTKRDFEGAMMRLFAANKIHVEAYGRSGDPRQRIGRTSEPDRKAG